MWNPAIVPAHDEGIGIGAVHAQDDLGSKINESDNRSGQSVG